MDYIEDDSVRYGYAPPRRNRKNRVYFGTGLVVILLALTGIVLSVVFCVNAVNDKKAADKQAEINRYNSYLIPVAAVDPASFTDVTTASMDEMIEISVWSIIGSDLNPDNYDYSSGSLAIPVPEVEAAFVKFFGTQVAIQHATVEGYGYQFEYSKDNNCYYIPLTGISPVYTPSVIEVEDRGGVITITCGLVYSSAWQQDYSTGEMVHPDPDKYITVIVRQQSGGEYISSVQATGKPETAA